MDAFARLTSNGQVTIPRAARQWNDGSSGSRLPHLASEHGTSQRCATPGAAVRLPKAAKHAIDHV